MSYANYLIGRSQSNNMVVQYFLILIASVLILFSNTTPSYSEYLFSMSDLQVPGWQKSSGSSDKAMFDCLTGCPPVTAVSISWAPDRPNLDKETFERNMLQALDQSGNYSNFSYSKVSKMSGLLVFSARWQAKIHNGSTMFYHSGQVAGDGGKIATVTSGSSNSAEASRAFSLFASRVSAQMKSSRR